VGGSLRILKLHSVGCRSMKHTRREKFELLIEQEKAKYHSKYTLISGGGNERRLRRMDRDSKDCSLANAYLRLHTFYQKIYPNFHSSNYG
jgi:hypothetical protein